MRCELLGGLDVGREFVRHDPRVRGNVLLHPGLDVVAPVVGWFDPRLHERPYSALENPHPMKRIVPAMLLVLLLAPHLLAAEDLTGQWGGTLAITQDGTPSGNIPARMVLKQTGVKLTGTLLFKQGEDEQLELTNGKVQTVKQDGRDITTVTFTVKDAHDGDEALVINFSLTLVDGHLKGQARVTNNLGQKIVAVMDVTRAKN
jgi:hypothetical protein